MNLDLIKKRVETYLKSNNRWPIVVDFSSKTDLANFVNYFNTGENQIISASTFCHEDGVLNCEEFLNKIDNNKNNSFVVHLSGFLKLQGNTTLRSVMKNLLSKSIDGHLVVVMYKCNQYLKFADPRFEEKNQILFVDGVSEEDTDITFIGPDLKAAFPNCYQGASKIGVAYEMIKDEPIYISTLVEPENFAVSLINIHKFNNSYEVLCKLDVTTTLVSKSLGTVQQWNKTLTLMNKHGGWSKIIDVYFGGTSSLANNIHHFLSFDPYKKWLYYVSTLIYKFKEGSYLKSVISNASSQNDIVKSIYRTILDYDHQEAKFDRLYNERKEILQSMKNLIEEPIDFCKVLSIKGSDAIYYLTDLSQPEREKIIEWAAGFGAGKKVSDLIGLFETVYPDLAMYLSKYRTGSKFIDSYFDEYKFYKLVNKFSPEFKAIVDEQAEKLEFADILPPRSSILSKIDVSNSEVYFVDALGLEYLGFIQSKCNEYNLHADVSIARCELPSLTEFNDGFVAEFKQKGCEVKSVKDLDNIKHHGEENFDYEKVKTPLYLIEELKIIDEVLQRARAKLASGAKRVLIVSDHGASRLAVINETENMWKMGTKGVHSGRCCPQSEIDTKPATAISAENYWVLTNYDRFQGGRKANVEVHGGATIEEVAVPIIELSVKNDHVEAFILKESKVVMLAAKEIPVLKLYVAVKNAKISIKINDAYYDAEKTADDYVYSVTLNDLTKKGIYSCDILYGNEPIARDQQFEIKKKGFTTNSLFD